MNFMMNRMPVRIKEQNGQTPHRLHVKITAFLLVFAMACTAMASLPLEVYASPNGDCGDNMRWSFNESTGRLTISGSGAMWDNPEFSSYSITAVSFSGSITSIGNCAFHTCPIKSVTIPDSVISIGDDAFSTCDSLQRITIGNSVKTIGEYAFNSCGSLQDIIFGNSVKTIGNCAFRQCQSLTSVIIPDSVISIGDDAFYCCDSLQDVTIGNSVRTIGDFAFSSCSSLETVTMGDSLTSIGYHSFYNCPSLSNFKIPDSVTSIGDYAFEGCDSLTSVIIPDSVVSIGIYAFHSCNAITDLVIGNSVISIDSVFNSPSALKNVTIGNSVTSFGGEFYYCDELESIIIGNSVTSIDSYALSSRMRLKNVKIGNSVTTIEEYAFYNCQSLPNIVIPDSVTSIGYNAFESCSALSSVTIGNSVTSIEDFAFDSCSSLTTVMMGKAVASIGLDAFDGCEEITDVYYAGSESDWNEISIQSGNGSLLNATIHYNSVIRTGDTITLRLLDAATGEDITGLIGNVTYKPKDSTAMGLLSPENCPSVGVWQIPGEYYPLDNLMIGVNDLTTDPETGASYHKYGGLITLNDVNAEINDGVLTVIASDSSAYAVKTSVSDIEIISGDISLKVGEKTKLYAQPTPYTYFNQECTWSSSDSEIVEVLQDGTVIAHKTGSATITAESCGRSDSVTVTVNSTSFTAVDAFNLKTDKYKFTNYTGNFNANYHISQHYYDILTRSILPHEKQNIDNNINRKWGGSCYGMSAVTVLYKNHRLPDLSLYGAKNLHELSVPKSSTKNGGEVESLINFYHLMQQCDVVDRREHQNSSLFNCVDTNDNEAFKKCSKVVGMQLYSAGLKAEYSHVYSIIDYRWLKLETSYEENGTKHTLSTEQLDQIQDIIGANRVKELKKSKKIILTFTEWNNLHSLNIDKFRSGTAHAVMITGIKPFGNGKYKLQINDPNHESMSNWVLDFNNLSIASADQGSLTQEIDSSTLFIYAVNDDINIIDYISLKNGLQLSSSRSIKANFLKANAKTADFPDSYIDTSCDEFTLSDGTNTYSSRDSQSPVYWTKGEADEETSRKYKVELDKYTIVPLNTSGADSTHEFTVYAGGFYGRMKAQGLKSYTVTKNGQFSLDAKGDYQLTVASDTMPSGKWGTLKLSGSMTAPVSVDVTAEGFVISGDIANANLICEGKNMTSRNLTYSLTANKALVTAKNGEIAVLTDKNNDGTFETEEAVQGAVAVTYLELQERTFELQAGQTAKITPVITPSNAANKKVHYTSNDKSVATVAADGTITAVGTGRTTVTAKTDDGGWTASCEVVVPLAAQSVALSASAKTLNVGESFALTATVTPANSTDYIEWAVEEENQEEDEDDRESVINIDSDGNVLACNPGKATVTAKVGEKTASCTFTVKAPVTGIELLCDKLTMARGMTQTMNYLVFPANTTDTSAVVWTSSNENVVKVTDGKFTAVSPGTATVTAKKGGFSAKCVVTVVVTQEALEIKGQTSLIGVGKTLTLNAAYVPADATKQLKLSGWSSSDESVATVDANGKVTGVSAGTAIISTSTQDKINKAEYKITVASLSFKDKTLEISAGESKALTATAVPSNLPVEYASSDNSIVTVDNSGKIKGLKEGKATVTAKIKDSEITAKCEVTVLGVRITTQPTDQTINLGDSVTLSLKAEGTGLTYQWYYKKVGQTSFSAWSGRTHASETATPNATWDGIQLYCIVKDSTGKTVQSDTATVTVKQGFSITQQPTNKTIKQGDSVTLSLKAEGSGLTYQWYYKKAGQTSFSAWKGRTHASETATPNATWNGIQLYCKVKDSTGKTIDSNTVKVLFSDVVTIVTQPANVTAKTGDNVKFTVQAKGVGLTYQWYYKKAGATSWSKWGARTTASTTATSNATWNGMQVYCAVKNSSGTTVNSNAATITISDALTITTQPTNKTITLGDSVTLSLKAQGSGLTYQWYYKKSGQTSFSTWNGRTHASETCTPNATWNGIQLYCIVKDSAGNKVQSNTVTVKVNSAGITITQQPQNQSIVAGTSINLTVKATGSSLKYQWYFKKKGQTSFNIWNGRTHATETVSPNSTWDGIQLYCKITDGSGKTLNSSTVTINVLSITTQPSNVTVAAGSNATFKVVATGSGLKYQWQYKKSGQTSWNNWGARTTASTTATSNATWQGMQVRCIVTDSAGNKVTSNAATITIK